VVPLQTCESERLRGRVCHTDAELAAMQKGADLSISMQIMPVPLTVPVLGFAAAYAKIK
jgi:hypothetical protein